jgi:hypothetical protein
MIRTRGSRGLKRRRKLTRRRWRFIKSMTVITADIRQLSIVSRSPTFRLHTSRPLSDRSQNLLMLPQYDAEELWFYSQQGYEVFLFSRASRPALGPTPPSVQWASGAFCLVIRLSVHEVDQSPQSRDEVKNVWSCTSIYLGYIPAWCMFFLCNDVVVLVTSSKLPVRPQSRGGLGEWPAPYPHRSADLCDPTAMTRHVARPQVVRGARLLSGGLRQTFFLAEHKLLLGISSERVSQISIRDPQSSCAENASAQFQTFKLSLYKHYTQWKGQATLQLLEDHIAITTCVRY